MLWLPLIITIIYLIFTIFLFTFGPILFYISQPFLFYGYMTVYLISIWNGYVVGMVLSRKITTKENATISRIIKKKRLLLLFMLGAIVASSIVLHVNSIFDLFNPRIWFNTVVSSLMDLQSRYALKMEGFRQGQSNKLVNIVLFIFAPYKVLFIVVLIGFWPKIKWVIRVLSMVIVFIVYLMPALNTGTNKPIFDLMIFATVSLAILKILYKRKEVRQTTHGTQKIIFLTSILTIAAFSFFALNMEARGGQSLYIESTSPRRDITVRPEYRIGGSRLQEAYVWFVGYLVQGYYGFSLSLEHDFTTTYGFGSSIFLTRQIKDVFGINLFNRTYQSKINTIWDENAQWHSFYSYAANDVGFLGVTVVCFSIGALLAIVWYTFLVQSNFWSYLLLPVIALMLIYIPANNQVFGFLESFSSFFFAFTMWVSSIRVYRKSTTNTYNDKALPFLKSNINRT